VNERTPNVLARILQSTREEVERRKRETPQAELQARLAESAPARGLRDALTQHGISVIAEFKRRSPSAGALHAAPDLAAIVTAYERGGAGALSILTEGSNFGGSLDDLRAARELCRLPILRKDFIVDEYQLTEARAAGADAVLLIVAALDAATLARLHEAALALALDVLVEVHDRHELDLALGVGARLIGVNNRDLRDFSVDVDRTLLLRGAIPDGVAVVSESGICRPEQLRMLEGEGVDAVLVGEALMRSPDPAGALRALLAGTGTGAGAATGRRDGGAPANEAGRAGEQPETAELPSTRS
jgi:indole-3-glycerol phosphate synthase